MALHTFGWTDDAVTQDFAGNVRAGVQLTVWADDSQTTQVTSLFADDGTTPLPGGVVVSDSTGRYGFKAADTYSRLYVSGGMSAKPYVLAAHEALDAGVASHAQAVTAAQAAQVAAENAAALVDAPADDVMAAALGNPASQSRTVLSSTFVRGIIIAPGVSGVVGDGATDDTAAIQALINSAPKGGTVYLSRPAGGSAQDSYKITAPLTVTTQNLRLVGVGRDVYATNLKMSSGAGPMIVVKAAGFVLQNVGIVGNGGSNGAGATVDGLDLFGDLDGNIDARISGASFQYLAVCVRTRGRNAAIRDDTQFSNSLVGVRIDGKDATYHTGPAADQNRANTVQGCRFHNIGATSTDAAIDITSNTKVLHAVIADNYFDSNGLGRHIVATGTSSAKHEKITCRDNKHTETSAHAYDFTHVNNSTIIGADVSANAAAPTDHHAVKLTSCDTVTVADVFAIQVGTSGIYARSCTKVRVRDCSFRSIGIFSGTTGHGLDFDSTNDRCRFDRVTVETADGWGFTGEPTLSSMTDCDFTSCTLGRLNSLTLTNRVASGLNGYVEGRFGRLEDVGRHSYNLDAGVSKQIATVVAGSNFGSFTLEIEFTARDSVSTTCYVYARRNILPENGSANIAVIGTDAVSNATVSVTASGTTGAAVSITTTRATFGSVIVRAAAGGAANSTNSRGVTVTMAAA